MLLLVPTVQAVPAANSPASDQTPEAHCWNEVPSIQFHAPSLVQVVPGVYVVFEEEEEMFEAVGRGAVAVVMVEGRVAVGMLEVRMVDEGAAVGTETAEVTEDAAMDDEEEAATCANTPPVSDAKAERTDEASV